MRGWQEGDADGKREMMNDSERVDAGHQANVLEIAKAVRKFLGSIRIPLEHSHAGAKLRFACDGAFLVAVFPVDGIAAVIDIAPLIPEGLHKQARTVDASCIIRSGTDVRPAKAGFN